MTTKFPETETFDEILIISEVARELKCSKAHVYKAIRGEVAGVRCLPVISMGTRRLILRSSLEKWKHENEASDQAE